MRVLVVGAGLGGLCLAQGLRRRGVDVDVFERDAALDTRRQGYRLHIDARADEGLTACLPPHLYTLFRATTGHPSRRITVLSSQLRVLRTFAPPGTSLSTSVDRATLRHILAADLPIRFRSDLTHYETLDDGVRAHFADGSTAEGDILVGADGIGSTVRTAYLPEARTIDLGVRCVYGRTPLAAVADVVPEPLRDGFCPVTDLRRLGLALGIVQFQERPAAAGARLAVALPDTDDYVMWSLSARRGVLGSDQSLFSLDAPDLRDLVADRLTRWHPHLRALVDHATPEATFALRIRSSLPHAPWPPSRITLLGDAIHAMSPSQGSGANLALQDAGRLCAALTERTPAVSEGAARTESDVVAAIGFYEDRMRTTGFAAVRAGLDANRGPLGRFARGVARLLGFERS